VNPCHWWNWVHTSSVAFCLGPCGLDARFSDLVLEAFNGLNRWVSEGGDESAGILYVLPQLPNVHPYCDTELPLRHINGVTNVTDLFSLDHLLG